jgi:FHS family L-fucose permease-like MFS transporter
MEQHDGKASKPADAWKHPLLRGAVIAQFFYVGAQVCVFSFFILYATRAAGIERVKAADYLGWGCGMAFMVGRFAGTYFMKFIQPARLLAIYATLNIFLCAGAMMASGIITVFIIVAMTFFMSIMFPTIFALGIKGIGRDTEMGQQPYHYVYCGRGIAASFVCLCPVMLPVISSMVTWCRCYVLQLYYFLQIRLPKPPGVLNY